MSNYNQKLFSGGARSRLHRLRFEWIQKNLHATDDSYSLFELGCFDCRSLRYLPKPARYVGADAGWEGGINDAQMTSAHLPWMKLVMAQSVYDLAEYESQKFDYSIALETLEHIPDAVLEGYIAFLARVTTKQLLITVPVEIGAVFLAKYIAKKTIPKLNNGETETYSLREVYWATRGRTDHVRRYEHKGFDYRKLITALEQYFTIRKVEGIPFKRYSGLSFQVGIIAEPKVSA
jgi:hypothetical protein